MPTVLRIDGYRFFFFSNEGNEPVHIHIESGEVIVNFGLNRLLLLIQQGYNSTELNKLRKLVEENNEVLEEAWHEYFS